MGGDRVAPHLGQEEVSISGKEFGELASVFICVRSRIHLDPDQPARLARSQSQ